jgi:glutamyl-tRNA reductase
MGILVLGLNHRTAPVQLREQLAFSREGAAAALMLFKEYYPECEAVILSTCNRVELIVSAAQEDDGEFARFLARARNLGVAEFARDLYTVRDHAAIRHIFRVISGLDSMVLGEYQIVNQLKAAYQLAHEQGTVGAVLHRLLHHAFGVSKRVRTETTLSEGKTSVSSVAVEVIRQKVADYQNKRILIVGAGEMAQLTVQHLRAAEARQLVITTRTLQNARVLAEACQGEVAPFSELDEELALADVVVTSTTCPTVILTKGRVRRALAARPNDKLLLIDLAVPRNIEAEAGELNNAMLYDVDALGAMVEAVRRQRASAVESSEAIIEEEIAAFEKWVAQSKAGPLIEQMYADVRALADIEVRAMFKKFPELTEKQRDAVEQLADRLVAKLMHPCVRTMRESLVTQNNAAEALAEAFHSTRTSMVGACERADAQAPSNVIG